jgi:hypothetical protein
MKISFETNAVSLERRTSRAWFPQLSHTPWFDGTILMNDLGIHIGNRYGIKQHHIEEVLHWFFVRLESYSGSIGGQTGIRVVSALLAGLRKDKEFSWESKGLRDSRHRFVILAYLASDYESVLLAEALFHFWSQGMQLIGQIESSNHFPDWKKGLDKVLELLENPTEMDVGALPMIPHANLHRGRSPRALALPWLGHRARSLPAIRRRHNPDMRPAIPAYPGSSWTSPMISPIGYPRNDYFEELNNLQYQQSEMSMKLDNVDGKLDFLLAGYYY